MQILRDLDSFPAFKKAIITIGSFDGVHLGHQILLKKLKAYADSKGGDSVVITFYPHPYQVLHPDKNFFTIHTFEENAHLIAQLGIDYLIVIPFTKSFSQLSFRDFFFDFIIQKIGPQAIIMGPNHSFGHNKEGNRLSIDALCHQHHVEIIAIPEQLHHDNIIRSNRIREFIFNHEQQKAEELLGHALKIDIKS